MKIKSLLLTAMAALFSPFIFAENAKPNVILIMADDMGYSDLGCYGGEINTPNLDALAAGGVRFSQFYNGARCCPTRASLMTGLYPHEAGMGAMTPSKFFDRGPSYQGFISSNAVTIAEVLKKAGYITAMTGKWHAGNYQPDQWPESRGFEKFYGIHHWVDSYWKVLKECDVYHDGRLVIQPTDTPVNQLHPDQEFYTTDVFTDWALTYIDEAGAAKKPLFMYVAYNAPHWPLEAPDEDIAQYKGMYDEGWEGLREKRLEHLIEMGLLPKHTTLSKAENRPDWNSLSEDDRKNSAFRREIYAAQIDRMDQNVGRIVKKLKEREMYKNTLILFLSDNGCSAEDGMLGYKFKENRIQNFPRWRKESGRSSSQGKTWSNVSNAPFKKHKKVAFEGGSRTPLIAHWPEGLKNPGRILHEPGHITDIMSTCIDLAGTVYPKEYNGNQIKPASGLSLLPLLQAKQRDSHEAIFCEHWNSAFVRSKNWKLVTLNYQDPRRWELYNLNDDPCETQNLRSEFTEKTAELYDLFINWSSDVRVLPKPASMLEKPRVELHIQNN